MEEPADEVSDLLSSISRGMFLSMGLDVEQTQYGFRWGPLMVERRISDKSRGVELRITTSTGKLVDIRVSPGGQRIEVGEVVSR